MIFNVFDAFRFASHSQNSPSARIHNHDSGVGSCCSSYCRLNKLLKMGFKRIEDDVVIRSYCCILLSDAFRECRYGIGVEVAL